MHLEELEILLYVLVMLGLSVAFIAALRRINLPPLLAYIFAGALLGPHVLALIPEAESIYLLSEIGLVFLLFMLGLEFSLPRLMSLREPALRLGASQMLISTLSTMGIMVLLSGIGWQAALVIAGAMALSSTAIGVHQLSDQLELHQRHGQLVIAVLLFQDLAAIPLLAAIPILAENVSNGQQPLPASLLTVLVQGIIALLAVFALGRWVLRPFFHVVAQARSTELFTMTALLAALLAAWISSMFGLSLALGAFFAGVLLGESEYREQIMSDVRPFRDLLMGLFFIQVGMQLDPVNLTKYTPWLLVLVPGIILGKGAVIALLAWAWGYGVKVALRTGIVLGQGSEFGFAVVILALTQGLIDADTGQPVIAALVLSMIISPLLIRHNRELIERLVPNTGTQRAELIDADFTHLAEPLSNHVIVCGFGHVGQSLAAFLRAGKFRYAALEVDPAIVRKYRALGENLLYGEGSNADILRAAGVTQATALVITFDDIHAAENTVRLVRSLRRDLPIIVRISDDRYLERLREAGANDIVPEYVEAGTTLATHLLGYLELPGERLGALVARIREQEYGRLFGHLEGSANAGIAPGEAWCLRSLVLTEDSHAAGRSIAELGLQREVSLRSVRRGSYHDDDPDPTMVLHADDVLILQGPSHALEQAERLLLQG